MEEVQDKKQIKKGEIKINNPIEIKNYTLEETKLDPRSYNLLVTKN